MDPSLYPLPEIATVLRDQREVQVIASDVTKENPNKKLSISKLSRPPGDFYASSARVLLNDNVPRNFSRSISAESNTATSKGALSEQSYVEELISPKALHDAPGLSATLASIREQINALHVLIKVLKVANAQIYVFKKQEISEIEIAFEHVKIAEQFLREVTSDFNELAESNQLEDEVICFITDQSYNKSEAWEKVSELTEPIRESVAELYQRQDLAHRLINGDIEVDDPGASHEMMSNRIGNSYSKTNKQIIQATEFCNNHSTGIVNYLEQVIIPLLAKGEKPVFEDTATVVHQYPSGDLPTSVKLDSDTAPLATSYQSNISDLTSELSSSIHEYHPKLEEKIANLTVEDLKKTTIDHSISSGKTTYDISTLNPLNTKEFDVATQRVQKALDALETARQNVIKAEAEKKALPEEILSKNPRLKNSKEEAIKEATTSYASSYKSLTNSYQRFSSKYGHLAQENNSFGENCHAIQQSYNNAVSFYSQLVKK